MQKVKGTFKGQFSSWADVNAAAPQRSTLRSLLFLMYINYLTNDLSSSAKLFADDRSLVSVVFNVDTSAKELNDDLAKFRDWALQWKTSFNPDTSKQAQKIIFCRKLKKTPHSPLMFNNNQVNKNFSQKYVGVILDESLSFEEHLKTISVKTLFKKLSSKSSSKVCFNYIIQTVYKTLS